MAIVLPDETREALVASIRRYVLEELDEEIGDLPASFFLDFVLKEVGPSIYNQAISDAQARLRGAVDDLDGTLFETEFGYTAERRTQRNVGGKGRK